MLSSSPRASRLAGSPCPYVEGWVYIDPGGLVNPCPYWNTADPLGNLVNQSFVEVLASDGYRRLRASLADGRLAGNCALCPEIAGAGHADIPKQ
jgi:MoaA/NifB/PqqE/SkfB family radical SAM enzyme